MTGIHQSRRTYQLCRVPIVCDLYEGDLAMALTNQPPLPRVALVLGNDVDDETYEEDISYGIATRRRVYDPPILLNDRTLSAILDTDCNKDPTGKGREDPTREGRENPIRQGREQEDSIFEDEAFDQKNLAWEGKDAGDVMLHAGLVSPEHLQEEQEADVGFTVVWKKHYYRCSPEKLKITRKEVDDMLDMGVVHPSCTLGWRTSNISVLYFNVVYRQPVSRSTPRNALWAGAAYNISDTESEVDTLPP
ncbi:hypothetical protein CAPTEDRAFT_203681 [Capitella teleta]|uniref:Uncharacterized protein n=1 Tax=Capitella teleta TaxID=283909 RepID=R7TXG8_CAPTE|nr:hypothetical protein CAPTEDRAFT_203681 [Capitella teleta]|eukprot:ELT98419.1 hypothetical protein CAPTEDRAFT_203681 [Capitella teleta]